MGDVTRRIFGPEHDLTIARSGESLRVALLELPNIRVGDLSQRNAECVGGDRQAPEHIAKLLDEPLDAGLSLLEDAFADETKDFPSFFGHAGGRVEQTLFGRERTVGGPERGALEGFEVHKTSIDS